MTADLRRLVGSQLARSSLWAAVGQLLRAGVQVIYFVIIARSLGAREYGAYVAVLAVVAIAAPFASLGSGSLLVKHVARAAPSFSRYWGKALVTTVLTGALLLVAVTVGAKLLLPATIPVLLVVLVSAADLIFVRLVDVSAMAYQGHQRIGRTAMVQFILSPLRLVAGLVLLLFVPTPTVLDWGMVYLTGALLGAGFTVGLATHELGRPILRIGDLSSELREGTFFATTLAAQTTTNDIDKAMLARLASLDATGVYGAAYRLVDMAFLPIGAVLVATYPRFFAKGLHGIRATGSFAGRLLRVGVCYALAASIGLYLLAPLAPIILGAEYPETVAAVRWLAVLPLLKTIHYFGADALMGAGYQGLRTMLLVGIAGVNVILNLWLIPLYSWEGAAAATIVSDGLFALAVWTAIWYLGRHGERPTGTESPAEANVGR